MERELDRELEELFGGHFPLNGGHSDSAVILPSAPVDSGPSAPEHSGSSMPIQDHVSKPTDSKTSDQPPVDQANADATLHPQTEAQPDDEMEIDQLGPRPLAMDVWLLAYNDMMKRFISTNHDGTSHDDLVRKEHFIIVACAIHLDHVLFKQLRDTVGPKILKSFDEFRRQGFCIKADMDWIGAELSGERDLADDITNCKAYEQLMRLMYCIEHQQRRLRPKARSFLEHLDQTNISAIKDLDDALRSPMNTAINNRYEEIGAPNP